MCVHCIPRPLSCQPWVIGLIRLAPDGLCPSSHRARPGHAMPCLGLKVSSDHPSCGKGKQHLDGVPMVLGDSLLLCCLAPLMWLCLPGIGTCR